MAQAVHEIIDPEPLQSLREILHDTDASAPVYSEMRLIDALRDHRETVLFRNPLPGITGIQSLPVYIYGRNVVPLNETNTWDSHLTPEPDLRSFQAKRTQRHWDSQQSVRIYRDGLLQTLTTDYTVNYAEGRVAFTFDVQDWEAVCASYCFYRIYHAARQIMLAHIANPNGLVMWSEAGVTENYGSLHDRLAAIDALIGSMAPQTLRVNKKVY